MCRITGFIDFAYNHDYPMNGTISAMRDSMTYAGPDDSGAYVDEKKGIALGHRRLSIIDLSSLAHQPMSTDNGRFWITYNGEVYNFAEIRKNLESSGYKFKSNSDTEVIVKAFDKWGHDAVGKFRGMFAFAIWDRNTEKLILYRDRAGVKPLYWYCKNNLFMFASELKAFHKHPKFRKKLDAKGLSLYLKHGYITAPHTIFKDTYKLEPGHYLEIDKNQRIKKYQYWEIKTHYTNGAKNKDKWLKMPEEKIAEELEEILTDSFSLRMVADVPVGMFLSGGVDSSLVTALLQKKSPKPVKTFTIGFHDERYNEAEWAKKVARHIRTDHTELYCTSKDALQVIPSLPNMFDEPFGDSSAIPTYLVSKLARRDVKVSLSADGGDELFCGYARYRLLPAVREATRGMPQFARKCLSLALSAVKPSRARAIYEKAAKRIPQKERLVNFEEKYTKLVEILASGDFGSLSEKDGLDASASMMLDDFENYLPGDLLTKVDRATMSVALEGRDPFLDQRITEYAAALPTALKCKNGQGKYILRKVLYKYVPKELIERPKQGFAIPVHEWFKKELKDLFSLYMNNEKIKKDGILDATYVRKLLALFLRDKPVDRNKLWYIFSFQLWKEKWL